MFRAEKGNSPAVQSKLGLPALKLLSSSEDTSSNLKVQLQVRPVMPSQTAKGDAN